VFARGAFNKSFVWEKNSVLGVFAGSLLLLFDLTHNARHQLDGFSQRSVTHSYGMLIERLTLLLGCAVLLGADITSKSAVWNAFSVENIQSAPPICAVARNLSSYAAAPHLPAICGTAVSGMGQCALREGCGAVGLEQYVAIQDLALCVCCLSLLSELCSMLGAQDRFRGVLDASVLQVAFLRMLRYRMRI
jgi:hypothetical protein